MLFTSPAAQRYNLQTNTCTRIPSGPAVSYGAYPRSWGLHSEFVSPLRAAAGTGELGSAGHRHQDSSRKMIGELGRGESAVDGIPQELVHDLIHLLAHQKMVAETQHILARCEPDDAIVLVGSDVKLRLDILAIDEELDNAIHNHDPDDPSKYFVRLLKRFDMLVSRSVAYQGIRVDYSVHGCNPAVDQRHKLLCVQRFRFQSSPGYLAPKLRSADPEGLSPLGSLVVR